MGALSAGKGFKVDRSSSPSSRNLHKRDPNTFPFVARPKHEHTTRTPQHRRGAGKTWICGRQTFTFRQVSQEKDPRDTMNVPLVHSGAVAALGCLGVNIGLGVGVWSGGGRSLCTRQTTLHTKGASLLFERHTKQKARETHSPAQKRAESESATTDTRCPRLYWPRRSLPHLACAEGVEQMAKWGRRRVRKLCVYGRARGQGEFGELFSRTDRFITRPRSWRKSC